MDQATCDALSSLVTSQTVKTFIIYSEIKHLHKFHNMDIKKLARIYGVKPKEIKSILTEPME